MILRRIGWALWPKGILLAFVTAAAFTTASKEALAQSFFATVVVDPSVGVDRGSAAQIQKLPDPTTFLTFDTYGAKDIGRSIASIGVVRPDLVMPGDQLDLVAVIAGPSADGGEELLAGGFGYRFPLGDTGWTGFVQADHANVTLGTEANLLLDAVGSRSAMTVGARRTKELSNDAKLIFAVELGARQAEGSILGTTVLDEEVRFLRASVLYEQGIPFLFQRRFSAAVTKGFDGFGASPTFNPLATYPGASTDFLRASASAEFSVPVSASLVVNAGVVGQWTSDSLPVSQRCGYGTNSYMRGFDLGYVSGDQCIGGRAEIAYNVELPSEGDERLIFTQAYAGIDSGWLQNNANALVPEVSDEWSSGSIGIRTIRGDFIGEISATRIFDQPAGTVPQSRNRLWLRAAVRF